MSKSRAIFGITKEEKRKIIRDRVRKENFQKSIYTYRVDKVIKELKEFHNIKSESYKKDNQYFLEFTYNDLFFAVKFDYDEDTLNFKNIYADVSHNNKVIKSFVYDNEAYLFNLLAFISLMPQARWLKMSKLSVNQIKNILEDLLNCKVDIIEINEYKVSAYLDASYSVRITLENYSKNFGITQTGLLLSKDKAKRYVKLLKQFINHYDKIFDLFQAMSLKSKKAKIYNF